MLCLVLWFFCCLWHVWSLYNNQNIYLDHFPLNQIAYCPWLIINNYWNAKCKNLTPNHRPINGVVPREHTHGSLILKILAPSQPAQGYPGLLEAWTRGCGRVSKTLDQTLRKRLCLNWRSRPMGGAMHAAVMLSKTVIIIRGRTPSVKKGKMVGWVIARITGVSEQKEQLGFARKTNHERQGHQEGRQRALV